MQHGILKLHKWQCNIPFIYYCGHKGISVASEMSLKQLKEICNNKNGKYYFVRIT